MANKLGVGLYGSNGHQVFDLLDDNPRAECVAAAGVPAYLLESLADRYPGIRLYDSLEAMMGDSSVQLVSLCSAIRANQAEDALLCMRKGRHVYAEKPCALSVGQLDLLMETARQNGVRFHEMAGTAFDEPWRSMAELVRSGALGEVVQVLVQKSYPFHAGRPQDEGVDGGLLCQVGVHAMRMVEHVAGRRIQEIAATQTALGNPVPDGGLHVAASYMMRLSGGAVASAVANYLNHPGFGLWGNEMLRVFGTKGFVEATDGGTRTRLVIGSDDLGPLTMREDAPNYFDLLVASILDQAEPPLTMEEELHPTRAVLVARQSAQAGGRFLPV